MFDFIKSLYLRFAEWLFQSFPFLEQHPILSLLGIIAIIIIGWFLVDHIAKKIIQRRKQKQLSK